MNTHRRILYLMLSVFVVAASVIISAFGQQDKEKEAWDKAIIANTIVSLDSYLVKYPDGKHAQRVQAQKAELESDAKRKIEDANTIEQLLGAGKAVDRPALIAEILGEDYKLWRSLTQPDHGRTMFQPLPDDVNNLDSESSDLKLRDWPPELVEKAGAKNFIYISIHSDMRVGSALARTLEGNGLLNQVNAFGMSKITVTQPIPPTGKGSVYLFKGKVKLLGLEFLGDTQDPLRFVVMQDGSWVYLSGKGTVANPDGKKFLSKQ